ncbi:DUF6157 family protein [Peribacillus frigoritolerans]|jgi:hypothetical protein|uniref:DUF6157 family protein n=1 Tax=Peribacillus TaxID=2675229 RepID=UPI000BAC9AA3|nr:DUF6157 family protein [Peribacillus frigoritolerans]MBD8136045.1 hypothetical protein [Bacillus sp. CFBP 13597]MBT2604171.1 hypothetical protein [Bacillus sp. ISL-53]MEC0301190.1 DUF6157 family protein [Peribacillus castrilensis]PAW26227.1 hypothetical protein BKC07_25995 [Peribacillus simplex]PHD72501.1 hypothetical protein COF64_21060 [Bacillus sp. AFS043905]PRS33498.1 hypothetical protein C6W19_19470 [Bacillus sp. RJGP41]
MSYKNTLITISEDSKVSSAKVPVIRNEKPTIAYIEHDLINNNPYKFTQEDVQFKTYLIKNQMEAENAAELREQFFSKSKACFRASPLVKNYGWGIHYNNQGKIAIYDVNSEMYNQLLKQDDITKLKGMRSKRK